SHFQERSGPHTLGVLFETVLPVSVIVAAGDGEKFDNFLHLAVLDDPAKSHHGNVVKWNHHLEAAGLNLQQVELFDAGTHGPAADLLDGSYAMVGVNDFIAYVENTVAGNHEGHPKRCGSEVLLSSAF